MKAIKMRACNVLFAFVLVVSLGGGSVSVAADDSIAPDYWTLVGDWSKKKESEKNKKPWPRVVKTPLLMVPPPAKKKEQPKRDEKRPEGS